MYAIVQQGGHQYRVAPGDRLLVDQLTAEVGDVVALAPVLVVQNDAGTTVGTPVVDGARVAAVVVAHRRGTKLRVFKYKPKKRYRRTRGHRSRLTELRIEALLDKGQPLPKAAAAPATKEPSPKAAATARPDGKAKAAPAPEAVTDEAPVKRSAPRTPKAAPADVVADTPEAKAGGAKRTRKTAKPGEEA
jgi:large subunit ribosomal protein L21